MNYPKIAATVAAITLSVSSMPFLSVSTYGDNDIGAGTDSTATAVVTEDIATVYNKMAATNKIAVLQAGNSALMELASVKSIKEPPLQWMESKAIPVGDTSFKSYMDKDTVTDRTSDQWEVIHSSYIDDYGFMRYDEFGEYLIAVAPYYGAVGDKLTVVFEGESDSKNDDLNIECIIGDVKDNAVDGLYHEVGDGRKNVVEFIVETSELERMAKIMGDCSYSSYGLTGDVKAIYRWPDGQVME